MPVSIRNNYFVSQMLTPQPQSFCITTSTSVRKVPRFVNAPVSQQIHLKQRLKLLVEISNNDKKEDTYSYIYNRIK